MDSHTDRKTHQKTDLIVFNCSLIQSNNNVISWINVLTLLVAGQVMVKSNFTLPDDMQFGQAQIIAITSYSIMFSIGFVLNTISLYQLLVERLKRKNRNRMNLLLIHLAVADLMVTILRYLKLNTLRVLDNFLLITRIFSIKLNFI